MISQSLVDPLFFHFFTVWGKKKAIPEDPAKIPKLLLPGSVTWLNETLFWVRRATLVSGLDPEHRHRKGMLCSACCFTPCSGGSSLWCLQASTARSVAAGMTSHPKLINLMQRLWGESCYYVHLRGQEKASLYSWSRHKGPQDQRISVLQRKHIWQEESP